LKVSQLEEPVKEELARQFILPRICPFCDEVYTWSRTYIERDGEEIYVCHHCEGLPELKRLSDYLK